MVDEGSSKRPNPLRYVVKPPVVWDSHVSGQRHPVLWGIGIGVIMAIVVLVAFDNMGLWQAAVLGVIGGGFNWLVMRSIRDARRPQDDGPAVPPGVTGDVADPS